jgi:hypothetical protein
MEYNKNENKPNSNSESIVADFGIRAVSNQNFSKVVALPKIVLENCGNPTQLNVTLIQENGVKFLKLTPTKKEDKNNV